VAQLGVGLDLLPFLRTPPKKRRKRRRRRRKKKKGAPGWF
jgi:hypothetical protein